MKGRDFFLQTFVFCLLVVGFVCSWQTVQGKREEFVQKMPLGYTLPSKILKSASLQFKGIVSDFLFIRTIANIGDRLQSKVPFGEEEKDYILQSVNAITDLDPGFWDPYLFAGMTLTWEYADLKAAKQLFEKAMQHRPWDWKPPYYIGFNCFYFERDLACGAHYIGIASQKQGSPAYLPFLASRLAADAGSYKPAILLLRELIQEANNPALVQAMAIRLEALELLGSLEEKVEVYHERFGRYPQDWEEMRKAKLIEEMPKDPYGGKLVIQKNRVFTTSRLLPSDSSEQ